jgi:hypothetical protein
VVPVTAAAELVVAVAAVAAADAGIDLLATVKPAVRVDLVAGVDLLAIAKLTVKIELLAGVDLLATVAPATTTAKTLRQPENPGAEVVQLEIAKEPERKEGSLLRLDLLRRPRPSRKLDHWIVLP